MSVIVTSPVDNEDKENLYRFLYSIWIGECGRELPGTDHEKEWITDPMDPWAEHFIALDSQGRIVGCVRFNQLSMGAWEPSLSGAMGFDTLSRLFGPDHVGYISHLAVSPAHRGGTVISILMAALFRRLIEAGMSVTTCYCRLGRVSLYHRIGMRPYLPNFHRNDLNQVPLIGCINDRGYFERTGSPLYALLPPERDDQGRAAALLEDHFPMFTTPEFTRTSYRNLWAQLAHDAPEREEQPAEKLLQGLTPKVLEHLLPQLPRISLSQNEAIEINRTTETAMGILVSGALGLGVGDETNPHFIYVIQPGEPFGELATLTRIRSSAVILALEASEVVLLPDRLFERLGKKDPATAIHLYQNLLSILARRTAAVNSALADQLSGQNHGEPRVRRPARHTAASLRTEVQREESYHFDTLSDQEGEFKRLTCQARIAESLEFKILKDIGLNSGDRILDLGSGPGITSMLLARHFPESRVIGVEPEAQLRSRAQALVLDQTPDRCCFLEGTAQKIPLPDNEIDFSYARLLFQHIPDPLVCLREMKRVTRTGGIVCILDVDDGTIFIHPEEPEWLAVEDRVARAQAGYGGDRHVGRKLLGYFRHTGFTDIQMDIVPITTQLLGPETFFDIVFGFKQQHLKRFRDWDRRTQATFARIREALKQPDAFASENIFVAHALVP